MMDWAFTDCGPTNNATSRLSTARENHPFDINFVISLLYSVQKYAPRYEDPDQKHIGTTMRENLSPRAQTESPYRKILRCAQDDKIRTVCPVESMSATYRSRTAA